MHAGKKFTFKQVFFWTRRELLLFIIIAAFTTLIYDIFRFKWMAIPWLPIALIGTAVAFLVGFKNNASYDRLWEARKIYGGIVNTSRTLGIMVMDFIANQHAVNKISESDLKTIHRRIIYRHIAWLTALRHQLRVIADWENFSEAHVKEFKDKYGVYIREHNISLEEEITPFLSEQEKKYILSKSNKATQLIALQSKDLKKIYELGLLDDFRHVELENILKDLYTFQGQAERIKSFPYPRQFATINYYFVWIFILLIPFGMFESFEKIGRVGLWLTVPFTALIAWIFHTMDKIGISTENPFEGGGNDVPITTISRTIEIDLREMLDEDEIPEKIEPVGFILT